MKYKSFLFPSISWCSCLLRWVNSWFFVLVVVNIWRCNQISVGVIICLVLHFPCLIVQFLLGILTNNKWKCLSAGWGQIKHRCFPIRFCQCLHINALGNLSTISMYQTHSCLNTLWSIWFWQNLELSLCHSYNILWLPTSHWACFMYQE